MAREKLVRPAKRPTKTLEEKVQLNIREQLIQNAGDALGKAVKDLYMPIDTTTVMTTGSTLLDLAILGGRVRGGGIPGGILVEIFGPSSSGKSIMIAELVASVQAQNGKSHIGDGEARLDKEFSEMFGGDFSLDKFWVPSTIKEVEDSLVKWNPKDPDVINMYAIDGICSLMSQLSLKESGDVRGQARAKELHELCRKITTNVCQKNKLVVFTNQERMTEYGAKATGGDGVGYLASLRLRIKKEPKPITKSAKFAGKTVTETIGFISTVTVKKSSLDYYPRTCPLYIVRDVGIDDVRANLQYLKDAHNCNTYPAVDKEYSVMNAAIKYIEENNLEPELREHVIDTWTGINALFQQDRKKKVRF